MHSTKNPAALLLRVTLGVMFLAHGLRKVRGFTLPGTVRFFESQEFPGELTYVITAAETGGGAFALKDK